MREFDIDKCYLTKDQILHEVGDVLIQRWEASPSSNFWIINIAKLMQKVLHAVPSKHVEQYYREAFKLVYHIMQVNARAADPTLQKLPAPAAPEPIYVKSEPRIKPNTGWLDVFKKGAMKD